MLAQPAQCRQDAVFYRVAGCPSEPAQFRTIEEDKRVVADPPALAAAVVESRREAELRTDPADRRIHRAILVGSEVEHLVRCLYLADQRLDRVYAVLDMQIGFALLAVAEH